MKQIGWFFILFSISVSRLVAEAHPEIFKQYDIRGVVGEEFLIEDVDDIAAAIATHLLAQDPAIKKVAVGADGRVHSPLIKERMIRTFVSYGWDVVDVGECTTPVIFFAGYALPVEAAFMITASHNPGKYNGIKICHKTRSVFGKEIQRIQEIYSSRSFAPCSSLEGSVEKHDLIADYINDLAARFPDLIGARFPAIIDCGNGAAGTVMPRLIEKMRWQHIALLYPEVDGTYPNHIADPTVESYMNDLRNALSASDAQFGLGFDGDCDRMAPMTKSGQLVKGDQLVAILSKPILEANPGATIVFDISSSQFIHELVTEWGGKPILASTGIASMKRAMQESRSPLGGEISCHTFFKDKHFGYDDGIHSMMRLFELLKRSESSLEELLEPLPNPVGTPLYRLACERSACLQLIEDLKTEFSSREDVSLITIDGLRLSLPRSWAIIRPSNTEPLISMRLEGCAEEDLNSLIELIEPTLTRYNLSLGASK